MIRYFALLALVAAGASATAQQAAPLPKLSLEQQTALRCSAAFAYVAAGQARGDPAVAGFPAMGARGKEFFVRTAAGLMDVSHATRPQVQELFRSAYADLVATLTRSPNRTMALQWTMQPCLSLLDVVVPPTAGRR